MAHPRRTTCPRRRDRPQVLSPQRATVFIC
ncbi:hypothetical protein Gotri_001688 [Gossypium trilobum]|uniref:Uncharacterized protein n=1 Tax=Gossypium trilobum TaxID=34281 RepID=A0A7J9FFN3_9ROSI|nr:hypothetical protein [Gossypium trilobum]